MLLKWEYKNRDLVVILNFNYKLSMLKFQNFTSMEEFLKTLQEIKKQFAILGKKFLTKILVYHEQIEFENHS